MKTYAEWDAFINKGRDKISRPIGTNKRALRNYDGSIALRLHNTDVVTLYPDGTEVIDTGGWNTQMTRRFLAEHSKARVWNDDGLKVKVHSPPLTAPKLWKCRYCKGAGTRPAVCNGSRWCYEDFGLGEYHRMPCEHGSLAEHVIGAHTCWRCDGSGRADYGSKPIHYAWDGGPLRIDCHGQPLGPAQTQREVATAGAPYLLAPRDDEGLGKYASDGRYEQEFNACPDCGCPA